MITQKSSRPPTRGVEWRGGRRWWRQRVIDADTIVINIRDVEVA